MTSTDELKSLSNADLLRRLAELVRQSRRVEAVLIAHIAEVDERRAYIDEASSMFTYCTQVLHLSEHEAYARITVARASRRYPALLVMLRDGRLHASGIGKLVPHLTDANADEVLARATHKTKRQIEELVATIAPQPDVLATVRKVPAPDTAGSMGKLGPDRVARFDDAVPVPPAPTVQAPASGPFSRCAWSRARTARSSDRGHAAFAGTLQGPIHRECRAPRQARTPSGAHARRARDRHRGGSHREARTPRSEALRVEQDSTEELE